MGKASRDKREPGPSVSVTHEPAQPKDWPDGHVYVELTGDEAGECIAVTIHGVRHYLHSTTAQALNESLAERITEWDSYAKSQGALGVLDDSATGGADRTRVFKSDEIANELANARALSKDMVRAALGAVGDDGAFTIDHLAFLGFVERAQAFHDGVVDMVERGNPLAAGTLLRSFAENTAIAFYLETRPQEFEKLRPGATEDFPIGRVVAAAQKSLPGFKDLYAHLSSMAHPSGAGAFQTLQVEDDGTFFWQSHPTFRSAEHALQFLTWLEELRQLSTRIIEDTAASLRASRSQPPAGATGQTS